jgi:hypothetical protein
VGEILSQGWWTGIGGLASVAALYVGWLTYKQGKAEPAPAVAGDAVEPAPVTARRRRLRFSTVALAIIAVIGFIGLFTSHQTPTQATVTSTGNICSFVVNGPTSCESTNPQVRVSAFFDSDLSGCTFVRDIDWGDGTSSGNITVPGGVAGPRFVDGHTYSSPGVYTILFAGEVTQGSCSIVTPTFQFELLAS